MKSLKDILYKVSLYSVSGNTNIDITDIQSDSRLVGNGSLFIATIGVNTDGHQYIDSAIEKGAAAIVCQILPKNLQPHVTYVQVVNTHTALGIIASNFYGNPSTKMKVTGVTGTNGKTTTVTLLYKLFRELGYSTGMLSTVENKINDETIPATHTTPDAISLNYLLSKMVQAGCTHCFMEVSSHAIVQQRIAGIHFSGAIFTNITHDHLDYHKTFDAYIKAKKMFFDMLSDEAFALVNADDRNASIMLQNTKAKKYSYALKSVADFKGKIITNSFSGLELQINGKSVWFKLIGQFNAYNLIAVYATAILLKEDPDEVLTCLSVLETAKGRFDKVVSSTGITAIIDYAHTPDALENVLETISELREAHQKIITVVGCGGDRDQSKRPLMASIAARMSDKVIFTSDNPRSEDPRTIIKQMVSGVSMQDQKKIISIEDRREAIKTACLLAQPHDIILIAGKGHENYQEINGTKYPFDDKAIVKDLFNLLTK
ncbi:MAG: UDP-N-acetylmuramoyl-L-alanyl-D-glutamate--2,6-diaminopimelate ligase [Cytophagaceae bacterium]|nr:UDP-N-acetylmuramoyl-L-alanyl-D-glutamate--2,6-diaminopimelate ligase [Cytophagaceae bacterium]MDW8455423.1 UDP-N-acetylmuramoyl-L-alanyl-D-glutamate--2,6-diaminopimelate ligase [Cytophagaceae bacterium]